MKNYMYSLIFLCFSSLSVIAQEPQLSFEHFPVESGWSSPLMRLLFQDTDGYIWFGSYNAVHRYDGFNIKSFQYDPDSKATITKGFVNVISEDKKGNLWIGSSSGLNNLNTVTGEFKQFIPDPTGPLFRNNMLSIYEDSKNVLWVGAAMGLYRMDQNLNQLQLHKFNEKNEIISNLSYFSITEDNQGFLWFGTSIGLLKFNNQTNDVIPVLTDPNADQLIGKNWSTGDYSVQCIHKDNEGILWIGTYGGKLLKLNTLTGKFETFLFKDPITSENFSIQSIAEEENDKVWVGTLGGLFLFDKISGKILTHYIYDENIKEGLNDDKITSVLKDKSGTLWVATLRGGLNKVNKTKFVFNKIEKKSWSVDKSYSIITFIDFAVSNYGSILVGTANGIEEIKPDENEIIKHKPFRAINTLIEDSFGNLWIAIKQVSGGGLYKKDTDGNLYPIVDSLGKMFNKEIQCFGKTKNGKVFFGTEFFLFEINADNNTASLLFQTNRRILSLGEDSDGTLWIGTMAGGLIVFDLNEKKVIGHFNPDDNDPTSISDNSITSIYHDKKGRQWIGTGLGLNLYNRAARNFKRYNEKSGLANNVVLFMIEDYSGKLWLGTAGGISRLDPETEEFRNYDYSYGLVEGYHYAGGKSESGIFYFKGRTGITYFHPDSIKDNPFIPPVYITELKVFDKSYFFNKEITLSNTENYLSFEFAALNYISPQKNKYAYKMEGVDKDWIYSGQRRYAAYTDLSPGKYKFLVKASNNDGVWNEEGTSLSITILPPWWQTYWAYALYFLALVLIVYSWRKYDLKRQDLKYQLKLEHANAEKQEEISRLKSRFFTNVSHEFRTPLTLIIGPAEKIISGNPETDVPKQAGIIKNNALRLLNLINQLLDISKLDEKKLKLQVSKRNLVSFVRGVIMNFESLAESRDIILSVKSERAEIEVYFEKEKMEKILTNIISNSFKFTPEGGKITVNIYDTYLNKAFIKIRDTGLGIPEKELPKLFDRFYQVDSSHTREHEGTGIGLALTKELVELHKGKISINSKEGEWTEVTIELPLGKDMFEDSDVVEEEIHSEKESEVKSPAEHFYEDYTGSETLSASAIDQLNMAERIEEDKLIILVVEDNADVREYIKDSLGNGFLVEEASNGEQGLRKAEMIIPDLIIGDIMMPKMDGYQMTKILKNDEKTNHIPIILLTAKSDQDSKFKGLESGADDYLIKPFNIRELQIRINNLITIRKTLQEKYSGITKINPEGEKKLSDVNEKFINRVIPIIQQHLAEEEFSIEAFSKELGMSRKQLYKKLKALTGKSPSRYLRSFRLSVAKEMIKEQKGNISEIAYSVGFSSPIYFSKCFKEEYGYPPSELLVSH